MSVPEFMSRTLRSLSTTPWRFRWLDAAALEALQATVAEAESGHEGEIRLLIERAMPLVRAWRQRVRERAEEMFAHLRVWDTAKRSGVLVYVNLAERRVELVADEGIRAVVAEGRWQALCDEAAIAMHQGEPLAALQTLLLAIGAELRRHFAHAPGEQENALPDHVVLR